MQHGLWSHRFAAAGDAKDAIFLQVSPFPANVIRHAAWFYFRFTLSFRDIEALLAQCGTGASYETVRCWTMLDDAGRCWTMKLGPEIAAKLSSRRAPPSPRWHLDEMVCSIDGERVFL